MQAIFLVCGAGGPQLKRNPLGSPHVHLGPTVSEETIGDLLGIGAAAALLVFWLRNRRVFRSWSRYATPDDQVLRQAMKLDKTDPAAADRMLGDYFGQKAARGERALDTLRAEAQTSLSSALQLQSVLRKRLDTDVLLRQEILRFPKPQQAAALEQLDASHQQTQDEIQSLEVAIRQLRAR